MWRKQYYWRKIFVAHKNLYGARKLPTIMVKFMAHGIIAGHVE